MNLTPTLSSPHRHPQTHHPTHQQNYSEIDAVKALLSMKSRASSMPSSNHNDPTRATMDQESTPKKGRRKQLLITPTKKPLNHDEQFGSPKSDEIDLDEMDDEELENPKKQQQAKHPKLLVKFASFSKTSPQKRGKIEMTDEEEEELELGEIKRKRRDDDESEQDEDDLDEDDEDLSGRETMLVIDDDDYDDDQYTDSSSSKSSNPLLELSRAAYVVEEKKKEAKK